MIRDNLLRNSIGIARGDANQFFFDSGGTSCTEQTSSGYRLTETRRGEFYRNLATVV